MDILQHFTVFLQTGILSKQRNPPIFLSFLQIYETSTIIFFSLLSMSCLILKKSYLPMFLQMFHHFLYALGLIGLADQQGIAGIHNHHVIYANRDD